MMSVCFPTAWQDDSESATAALLPDHAMFWPRQREGLQETRSCPILVVNPGRKIKGVCSSSTSARHEVGGTVDEVDFSQEVGQLIVRKHGSFVRGMAFNESAQEVARNRKHVPWAGVLSDG